RGGIDRFAARLARILDTLPASCPVLLHGDWGIGKTSLLHAIDRHARPRPVIWFHAWRYEREASLLPALLRRIWESTPDAFRKKEANREPYARIWKGAIPACTSLLPVVLTAMGGGAIAQVVNATPHTVQENLDALEDESRIPKSDATAELWRDVGKLLREA